MDFDLFVIGGGSGGVRAARLAAEKGLKVGLAEADRMGGTCVIRGCVPKKLMLFASDFSGLAAKAQGFGWAYEKATHNWELFTDKLHKELDRLEGIYTRNLERAGMRIFAAFAQIDDANHITLDNGLRFSAERILIATGGSPFVPEFEGNEHVLTSNDVFHLTALPKRLAIIGGGYIASEFTGIFHGLGVDVTQIYRGDMILRGYDQEMREIIVDEMKTRGITMLMNKDVERVTSHEKAKTLHFTDGTTADFDAVLYATGRNANIEGIGLENAGIETVKGVIKVDKFSRTNVPSIFAIGDVTGRATLTPVAIREAVNFIKTEYENTPTALDYDLIPTAVFTRPEFGTIGLSEEMARQKTDIDVYFTKFTPMRESFSGSSEKMAMKIIVDKTNDKVLGVHILGDGAGEMIQLVGIAVTMGATKAQFDQTIAVHPTAAEEMVTMKAPR